MESVMPTKKNDAKSKPAPKVPVEKPAPQPSAEPQSLPVLKYPRKRYYKGKKPGRVRFIVEGFFVPGPLAAEYEKKHGRKFICPAGPGMKPIPDDGQWYPVTNYLLRRWRDGDAAEGVPAEADREDIKLPAEGEKE
jgi:hypothetical protein